MNSEVFWAILTVLYVEAYNNILNYQQHYLVLHAFFQGSVKPASAFNILPYFSLPCFRLGYEVKRPNFSIWNETQKETYIDLRFSLQCLLLFYFFNIWIIIPTQFRFQKTWNWREIIAIWQRSFDAILVVVFTLVSARFLFLSIN